MNGQWTRPENRLFSKYLFWHVEQSDLLWVPKVCQRKVHHDTIRKMLHDHGQSWFPLWLIFLEGLESELLELGEWLRCKTLEQGRSKPGQMEIVLSGNLTFDLDPQKMIIPSDHWTSIGHPSARRKNVWGRQLCGFFPGDIGTTGKCVLQSHPCSGRRNLKPCWKSEQTKIHLQFNDLFFRSSKSEQSLPYIVRHSGIVTLADSACSNSKSVQSKQNHLRFFFLVCIFEFFTSVRRMGNYEIFN